MSFTNMAMTSSATVVTPVSSQSITRCRRLRRWRLRRRADALLSRTSRSQLGEGIPMLPG
jgi:hypothetical protein